MARDQIEAIKTDAPVLLMLDFGEEHSPSIRRDEKATNGGMACPFNSGYLRLQLVNQTLTGNAMARYKNKFGRWCSRDEAVTNGMLNDGYTVHVDMLMTDGAPAYNVADAERAFADSAEGRAVIARAQYIAQLNDRDFGPAEAARAVKAAMVERQAATDSPQKYAREADMAAGRRDAARAQYIARLNEPKR